MTISLANAVKNGLPIIEEDLYKKCDRSKYNLKLSQYKHRDADATVYDQQQNYDIILCLYYDKKCVSSVIGRYHESDSSMEILSSTQTDFENKKFNLYLRTAFIYLMRLVRPTIRSISSFSVNPISTYTMYKYYHASNDYLDKFVDEQGLTPDTFTVEKAREFHEYFKEKSKKTKEEAESELQDVLSDGYSLEDLGWDSEKEAIEFIINTTNVEAISLMFSLETPDIEKFLLDKLSTIMIQCSVDKRGGGTRKRKQRKQRNTKSKRRLPF